VKLSICGLGHLLLAGALLSVSAGAQQTSEKAGSHAQPEPQKEIERKEQSQRALGIMPRFGTTDRQDAPPLTGGGKFHLFARTAFDPFTVGIAGIQAGISQADDQFPGYGQGVAGYGKRFGAAFADEVSSSWFSNFLYPTLFKHDPRYFRLGNGTFKRRLLYGLAQEFVCHTDKGGRSFSYSNVLGALSGGALSNAYYPSSDRGFRLTMSRSGLALAYGAAGGLISEFWPDIQRKLFQKRKKENAAPPVTPPQNGNQK